MTTLWDQQSAQLDKDNKHDMWSLCKQQLFQEPINTAVHITARAVHVYVPLQTRLWFYAAVQNAVILLGVKKGT